MNRNIKIRNIVIALFVCVSVLFLLFFVYMGIFENVAVYNARDSHSYTEVTDYSAERIADEAAPAGVRAVYRWVLDVSGSGDDSLCFYLVHQDAQVYCDGELLYSLTAGGGNRIGGSIGSNWVAVPLYPEDAGKELTVVLTPLFENMVDFEPEFLTGSHFSIIMEQLLLNLPQLLISALCILVGLFIMAVQLYLNIRTEIRGWDMFFVGAFSILLGLWQITGVKSSPILFSANPMLLGYITIGVLFLCSAPLLLFAGTYFHGWKTTVLWILSGIISAAAALVLLLQVLGAADFKETLTVSHVMLVAAVCAIAAMVLIHSKDDAKNRPKRSWRLLLLPVGGIVVDLVVFYVSGSSSDIFFMTLVAFIIFALVTFVINFLETTKKAYMDARTGLTNKAHWNELMNADVSEAGSTAMMMLDLNGLKRVNDTLGHDAGDQMIRGFADILRRCLPKTSVICRWGGDEFAVMLTNVDKEQVEKYMGSIRQAVEDHNVFYEKLPIFYAVGCAYSADYPGLSRMELMNEADRQMYLDKRKWYFKMQNAVEG